MEAKLALLENKLNILLEKMSVKTDELNRLREDFKEGHDKIKKTRKRN